MAKRSNETFSIQDLMKDVITENNLSKGMLQIEVKEAWKALMGNGVVSYTKHIELRNDTLIVSLTSSVLRQELNYGKEKIITMLNEALKKEVIKKIRWV